MLEFTQVLEQKPVDGFDKFTGKTNCYLPGRRPLREP